MTTRKEPSGGGNKRPPGGLPRKPPGSKDRDDITQVRIIRTPTGDFDTEELPGDRDIGDYDKSTPGDLPGNRDIGDY